MKAEDGQLLVEARRQCERLLEELDRYRRELSSSPGRLSPGVVAAGIASIDSAAAAATKVLSDLPPHQ